MTTRADLALKLRVLRATTVRYDAAEACTKLNFDLQALRSRCALILANMGYDSTHPWRRSLDNSIESAFSRVLLVLLSNVASLDISVHDLYQIHPSAESLSGLFGYAIPPNSVIGAWKNNIRKLATMDISMLRCGIELQNLTNLDLNWVSSDTILSLNGPGCLNGAPNLKDLRLAISFVFLDYSWSGGPGLRFENLFKALGCQKLTTLRIMFSREVPGPREFTKPDHINANAFLTSLQSLEKTSVKLVIDIGPVADNQGLNQILLEADPSSSLRNFTALTSLVIPTAFLLDPDCTSSFCSPKNLPPKLQVLGLMYPLDSVETWVEKHFLDPAMDVRSCLPDFRVMMLSCHNEIGSHENYFTDHVSEIWNHVYDSLGIETTIVTEGNPLLIGLASLFKSQNETRHVLGMPVWKGFRQSRSESEREDGEDGGHEDG